MQSFAIIPAAGRSRRMGRPKLLLPWGAKTVVEHVLATWNSSRADHVIVVVDPTHHRLAEICTTAGARVIVPSDAPAEMKDSVRLGLDWAECRDPQAGDAWLVAPADMPGLKSEIIDQLIEAHAAGLAAGEGGPCIRVPRHGGKRGHPVLFPWPLAAEVGRLGADEGLNALVARHPVEWLEVATDESSEDFDTPEDYERLRARYGK